MSQITWEEIKESNNSENIQNEQKKDAEIYLIFRIKDSHYAINSNSIKEIIRNNELFPIPFAPDYIKGVLNYYGTPYATIDFSILTGSEPTDKKLYMILNNDSEMALQISDMVEFKNEAELALLPEEETEYCKGTFSFEQIKANIIDIDSIVKKVKTDLENK